MSSRLLKAAIAVLVLVPSAAIAGDDWKKDFNSKFASKNSWERHAAVKTLDPNDAAALKIIYEILKKEDWYIRGAAIDVLAGAYDAKMVDELKKQLKSGDAGVQEGICLAFGKSKDIGRVDDLIEALKKGKDWKVKRAAANALVNMPDKRAVGPLIDELEKEKGNFLLWIHVIEALEKITGQKNLNSPNDWRNWWSTAEKDWNPDGGEKKEGGEAEGAPKTMVKGTDLDFRSRGKGRPLLVLPEYGYEKDYLETYLRNLEDTSQILYMALPALKDFKDPPLTPKQGMPAPDYPIERLADTFEELRQTLVKDKKLKDQPFAIMGHGLAAWIAVKYAEKYPKGVSRIILVSPYAAQKSFGDATQRMIAQGKQTGDQELEHYARTRIYHSDQGKSDYEPQGDQDYQAVRRKEWMVYFSDWHDLEVGRIFGPIVQKDGQPMAKVERPMGGVMIPDFSILKEPEIGVPTMVMVGNLGLYTSIPDCEQIVKHFPKGSLEVFAKSASMPMIEENSKFVSVMQKFLAK